MNIRLKYLLLAVLFSSGYSYAQKPIVTGHIDGLVADTIYFSYPPPPDEFKGYFMQDKVPVKDGAFSWSLNEIPEPHLVFIKFPNGKTFELFLENSTIQIEGDIDAIADLKVKGSHIHDDHVEYKQLVSDLIQEKIEVLKTAKNSSGQEKAVAEAKIIDLENQEAESAKAFIKKNPKRYYSMMVLGRIHDKIDVYEYKSLYDLLEPNLVQSSSIGKFLTEHLVLLQRGDTGKPKTAEIGDQILDFTQNDTENNPVKISDFRGQYVLIDFWASWCAPCRADNPNVLRAYHQFKDKGFTVVGVSLDLDLERWKKAIRDDSLPWTQLSDLKGYGNEVVKYYGIKSIPTTFLIDPEGKIIAVNLRGNALLEKLAAIFD